MYNNIPVNYPSFLWGHYGVLPVTSLCHLEGFLGFLFLQLVLLVIVNLVQARPPGTNLSSTPPQLCECG